MNPRRQESRGAQKAHQEAQRALRGSAATLSLREATEATMLARQASDAGLSQGGLSQPGTPLNTNTNTGAGSADVHDLTQRLMAKVDAAKRNRVDAVIRRHGAVINSAPPAASAGKKTAPPTSGLASRVGPIRLDIRLDDAADGDDDAEELCILPTTAKGAAAEVPARSESSQASTPHAGGITPACSSPSASRHDGHRSEEEAAAAAEKDRQLLDNIRRRHEMRRLRTATGKLPSGEGHSLLGAGKERSLSPTDSLRSFPPPPPDAPTMASPSTTSGAPGLPASGFPRSPLLSAPPVLLNTSASLSMSNVTLQRAKTTDFTNRISAVCKDGDAEKIARLNSFDNATSRSTATFSGGSKGPAARS